MDSDEVGDCGVAALTRVPLGGGVPTGTVFSGQKTYDLAMPSVVHAEVVRLALSMVKSC